MVQDEMTGLDGHEVWPVGETLPACCQGFPVKDVWRDAVRIRTWIRLQLGITDIVSCHFSALGQSWEDRNV